MPAASFAIACLVCASTFTNEPPRRAESITAPIPTAANQGSPANAATLRFAVQTVLSSSGKTYLDARRVLTSQPEQARLALVQALLELDRQDLTPNAREVAQSRLLAVLQEVGGALPPEQAAAKLRAAWITRSPDVDDRCDEPSDPGAAWCAMLKRIGPAAFPAVLALVGDRQLTARARAELLSILVDISSLEQRLGLVAELAQADPLLASELAQALGKAADRDPTLAHALRAALDAKGWSTLRLTAWRLRWRLRTPQDTSALREWIAKASLDPHTPMGRALGLMRLLGESDSATVDDQSATQEVLAGIFVHYLARAEHDDRSEALALLALAQLAPASRQAVAGHPMLAAATRPRLRAAYLRFAPQVPNAATLTRDLDDPWPHVQMAAMDRLQTPCEASWHDLLRSRLHQRSPTHQSDEVEAVAIASVDALQRCGFYRPDQHAALAADTQAWDGARARSIVHLLAEAPPHAMRVLERLASAEPAVLDLLAEELQARQGPAAAARRAICHNEVASNELAQWLHDQAACPSPAISP